MDEAVSQLIKHYGVEASVEQFLLAPQKLFIDGAYCDAVSNEWLASIEASTGGLLAQGIDRRLASTNTRRLQS